MKMPLFHVNLLGKHKLERLYRCRDTGDYYQCSNGDYIDWSLGGSEDFQGCRMENFTIPEGSRCLRGQKCNIK